ncbi:MAG: tRNA (guanine(46)-N(7))-methyltransferase TrmB [Rhizobiaceae bacterium]|nr:tRNA (guanine(46)-N(7))-methyltransferase TrmB [Rhizobiaceae bacterium]MCV0405067.1 tRNA (guanine(46)-N(7))-methyltransferase TrmB [Rhizobiaceae bacterium]
MSRQTRARSTEAFFGRRRGKRLKPRQAASFALLDRLRLDLSRPAPPDAGTLFADEVDAVRLEIGFGAGENLLAQLERCPRTGFIGVEPFVNGMAKLLTALDGADPGRLRLHDDDATQVLDWLPDASLDGLDLFYPDPWRKKRHFKRRFVNPDNLDRFARVLRPGGRFRFASDWESYVDWALVQCRDHAAFEWLANGADDWGRPWNDWVGTRYEAKAIREGRIPTYLTFQRV